VKNSLTLRSRVELRHAGLAEKDLREANLLYAKGGEESRRMLREKEGELWPRIRRAQAWTAKHYLGNVRAARLCSSYPFVGELLVYLRLSPSERLRWGEAAVAAARRIKDRHAEAAHRHKLAMACLDIGEFRRAIPNLKQGAAINRKIKRPAYEASDYGGLGLAYAGLGEHARAIEFYDKALDLFRATGNADARWGEGVYLSNLGESWRASGDARKAITFHEEALRINREVGDINSEGYALGNLGKAYADLGEHERALEYFDRNLKIARGSEARQSEGYALFESSYSRWALGRRREAIESAKDALEIFKRIEDFYEIRTRKQLEQWCKEEGLQG
jgi:tetratricopeptide (TPR) repeat protein